MRSSRNGSDPPAAQATDVRQPLLSVSGVSVRYGAVQALDGVDLDIRRGELIALAGENGAGKTTLVRCVAGDIAPRTGQVLLRGEPLPADPGAALRRGIAVVWQDLALCDNIDVAGNVLLGQESRRLMFSASRLHSAAAAVLDRFEIPIRDTAVMLRALSGGQRQLVAVARAMTREPELLILDEPTAALGVQESRQVEKLIRDLHADGTTILLACHDIEQMFRLADRIVVLRQGRVVGDIDPKGNHPDDLVALLSGQEVDSSARRQLTRLHGLADRLASSKPSSSLSLILSALGSALGTERLSIHVAAESELQLAASFGFAPGQLDAWSRLPFGPAGGPVGRAAANERRVVEDDPGRLALAPGRARPADGVAGCWSVPVMGPAGLRGVITVFNAAPRPPQRDELDLVTLYCGYAASAIERDRLLEQVTARNRVLETIREMLETLAGPVAVADGLVIALQSLRRGLRADHVALVTQPRDGAPRWRAYAGPDGTEPAGVSASLRAAAEAALAGHARDGAAQGFSTDPSGRAVAVGFEAPTGPAVLLATFDELPATGEETALIEDAAHSLRLALEREEAALAHQEAAALRRSRELQRGFLSRLSHELRTPLTAIRGYASSLMQPDVTWDLDSQQRFLDRIAVESARLGRLVDDLLDFSAIESDIMRLHRDWCELPLVLEAAVACLPAREAETISVNCAPELPAIWADHDRLEQVFVNLLGNALRHNPPGTSVAVSAGPLPGVAEEIEIVVSDDGQGMPAELVAGPFEPGRRGRRPTAGAGLGLSIAKGIVEAHGGKMALIPTRRGTSFSVRLPVEAPGPLRFAGDIPEELAAGLTGVGGHGENDV